jgi:hypothetical protein
MFLEGQFFTLQQGKYVWWMFPSPTPKHILEFAPPPSDF